MARSVSFILSLFIIFGFLNYLPIKLNTPLKIAVGVLSLFPIFRIAIIGLIFLSDGNNEDPSKLKSVWVTIKNIATIGLGSYALYILTYSLGLLISPLEWYTMDTVRTVFALIILLLTMNRLNKVNVKEITIYLTLLVAGFYFILLV